MKKIGIFVNNWIFGNASIDEVVKRVAKIGFDGIELVGEPSLYKVDHINKLMKDNGLKVQSICGMFPGPEKDDLRALGHPDKKERDCGVDYVRACVDLAAGIGARSVLVVPSLVGDPRYFTNKAEDRARAIDSLKIASEYAASRKIYLTIEPINRYEVNIVYSVDDAIQMAKEVGNDWCRIMGDSFHMQIEEGDGIANAIRRAGKHWYQHMHLADNTREAPGMGTMPWREILRALMDIGFEGGVSCEPLPKGAAPYDARDGKIPAEKLDAELAFGLKYLREQMEMAVRYSV